MKIKIISAIIVGTLASVSLFAHSKAIKPDYIDMLLKPYFEVQTGLSRDNLINTQKSAKKFKEMLGHGPSFEDAPSLSDLDLEIGNIIDAENIEVARKAFHMLSLDLEEMIEHVGTTNRQNIFVMHCPMAFGGNGANWLQESKKLANPYFGSKMYSCGSVQTQLGEDKVEKLHNSHSHKHKF